MSLTVLHGTGILGIKLLSYGTRQEPSEMNNTVTLSQDRSPNLGDFRQFPSPRGPPRPIFATLFHLTSLTIKLLRTVHAVATTR